MEPSLAFATDTHVFIVRSNSHVRCGRLRVECRNPQGSLNNPAQHHTMPLDQDVIFARSDGLGPAAALKKTIEAGWLAQVNRHLSNLPQVIDAGLLKPGQGRRRLWQAKWEQRAKELLTQDSSYPYRVKKICWAPTRTKHGPTCDRENWFAATSAPGATAELPEVDDEHLRAMDKPGGLRMIVVYLEKSTVRADTEKKSYTLTFVPPNTNTTLEIECVVESDVVNMFVMPLSSRIATRERLEADKNVQTLSGGISVIMVQNWDLAIVWKQLERDPKLSEAFAALQLDDERDRDIWPKSRCKTGASQTVTDGERDLIVDLFHALRENECATLRCEDILRFMDKSQLDKARQQCKDASVAPIFAEFEQALEELDKTGFLGSKGKQHNDHVQSVEESFRKLLADDHLELSANDVAMVVTDADMEMMEDFCETQKPNMLLKAQMLKLMLRMFRRKTYLMAMAQAGLIAFTTRCHQRFSDGIPRLLTLVTAPNDRMEYEAEASESISIEKRVRSVNENIERGPRIPFRRATPNEPYPYVPYFELPVLRTGTDDCAFTHEERQTLIMSIIESENNRCSDTDDGIEFPSSCGAFIDLDEIAGEELCELYFPMHHAEAIELLQITWGMDVPARLGIADTPQRARRKGQAENQKLPPLPVGVILHAEQPLDQVRGYFGSHLAWYFAWMGFYTDALSVPSVVGLVVWSASKMGYSQDQLPMTAFYSIFISLWATVYLELWSRRQAVQAYEWGFSTISKKDNDLGVSVEFIKKMRRQFLSEDPAKAEKSVMQLKKVLKGVDLDTIQNDVVDYGLWYFPQQSRSRRQLVTGFVTFLCCVLVMSISQILFIFVDMSDDLGVSTQTVYTIKGITAGMLIPSLKFSYHLLAKKMADWETHPTAVARADSIAVKEFVFGYFNSYISLLWIAFFRSDDKYVATDSMTSEELRMQQLRTELFTVMFTAQFLNLAKEVIVPWVQDKKGRTGQGSIDASSLQHTPTMNVVIAESVRQMHCQRAKSNTDEYLKMVCTNAQPHQLHVE